MSPLYTRPEKPDPKRDPVVWKRVELETETPEQWRAGVFRTVALIVLGLVAVGLVVFFVFGAQP